MISNGVLFLIVGWEGILAGLINIAGFANVTPNDSIVSAVSTAGGYLNVVYQPLPATTIVLLGALAVLLVFEGGLAAYKVLKWGYSKVPGIT